MGIYQPVVSVLIIRKKYVSRDHCIWDAVSASGSTAVEALAHLQSDVYGLEE